MNKDKHHNPSTNTNKTNRPYGTWPSDLSADRVAKGAQRLGEVSIVENKVYWLASLPADKGRVTVMQASDNKQVSLLPAPFSAHSKVHEYGGGTYYIADNILYFVEASDQSIYALELCETQKKPSLMYTSKKGERFADLSWDQTHQRLLAIREHENGDAEPKASLVAIKPSIQDGANCFTLVEGADFYSNARVSADGSMLCWLAWQHPNMPWDKTELWLAKLDQQGAITQTVQIEAEHTESLCQPEWSPSGDLFVISDRNNWWNLYRCRQHDLASQASPTLEVVLPMEAEFGGPQWVFGQRYYSFIDSLTLIASYTQNGIWYLCQIKLDDEQPQCRDLSIESQSISGISAGQLNGQDCVAIIGASPSSAPASILVDLSSLDTHLYSSHQHGLNDENISKAEHFFFDSEGEQVQAFFYPPCNSRYHSEGLPPLIALSHGGPTGATDNSLNFKIQYWTQRGFAVADINYRGSTGFGRRYRERLKGHWGIREVTDICSAALYLADLKRVDKNKLIVKGSSAGGYSSLAALAFRDVFSAGVSLYGIGDLEILARDTHKFESRYLDKLIGPYPEEKERYHALSPIHHLDGFNCPLLVFQGLKDKVVPPEQAEKLVKVLREKGLAVTYVTYENEGHGFREQDTIKHMLETEHAFYVETFGLG